MKTSLKSIIASLVIAAGAPCAVAQFGNVITYQGQLKANGVGVNTPADFRFTLYNAASGGDQVGNQFTAPAVLVSSGLFTVNNVDFGVSPWTADRALWLQIEVRNPAGSGSFVPLGSRQRMTGAPYSLETRGISVAGNGDALLMSGDGPRVFGLPQGNNLSTDLHIQAGGPIFSDGSAQPGGNLVLRAGNCNQSFLNAPPVGTSNDNDVQIIAGDNVFLGTGRRVFNGNIRFFAGDGQPERARIVGDNGFVGIGTTTPHALLALEASGGVEGAGSLWVGGDDRGGLPGAGAGVRIFNDALLNVSMINAYDYANDLPRSLVINQHGGRIGFAEEVPRAFMHLNGVGAEGAGSLWVSGSDSDALAPEAGAGIRIFNDSVLNVSVINAYDYAAGAPKDLLINQTGGSVAIGDTLPAPGFTLDVNGNIRCVSVTQTSSSDFKQDIVPLNGALDAVMNLHGVSYAWNAKAPADVQGKRDIGFIAEDVVKILPDIVALDESGKAIGIDYGKVTPVAIEAIKTLKTENDQLKARLAALEAAVAKLAK